MSRSQYLLTDGQGPLQEGLGPLIFALIPVEDGQGMQGFACGGMLGSLHLLWDGQGSLIEGLSSVILAVFVVVVGQVLQEFACAWLFRFPGVPLAGQGLVMG